MFSHSSPTHVFRMAEIEPVLAELVDGLRSPGSSRQRGTIVTLTVILVWLSGVAIVFALNPVARTFVVERVFR